MGKLSVVLLLASIFENVLWAGGVPSPIMQRQNVKNPNRLWPGNTVPYKLDEKFKMHDRNIILNVMKYLERHSCIKFKKHGKEKGYIDIIIGKCCESTDEGYVGRRVGITLAPESCLTSRTVLHEFMHVLGFHHEHSRPDRDNYITVQYQNIIPRRRKDFRKDSTKHWTTLNYSYDFQSIMHYNQMQHSADPPMLTIVSKTKGRTIGKAKELSKWDKEKLNKIYSCPPRKTRPQVTLNIPSNGNPFIKG